MQIYINKIFASILSLPRYSKKSIAILSDICLCILATWIALVLRLDKVISFSEFNIYSALISVFIAIPIFWLFGLYKTVFRYTGLSIIFSVLTSILIYTLVFFLIITVYGIPDTPRSIGIIQPLILFFAIISSRLSVKFLLIHKTESKYLFKKNVLIYGAGEAGRQLVIALENSLEFYVVGFLDDNQQLHRQTLLGKIVFSPLELKKLIIAKEISLVFLALPSINRIKRNQIIERLNQFKLLVKTLPSISDIVNEKITLSDINDFNINDLLNREETKPDIDLLKKNIESKTVLVTGAGGSIGSELCRQIVKLNPKKLLLLDFNEFSLYLIHEELSNYQYNVKILPLLINANDQSKIELILKTFNVDTIYHAAAYKHVPLVEQNVCEGVKNNVFCTLAILKAAIKNDISNLVLISSDKAVRPTNIMGASKRLSELCMQGLYNYNSKEIKTNFSIVRFGNVLESSGSVIPKFKNQIREGGPITLTHENVTRYFMTVKEAAQLVIQAGAMGKKSEVFVLDMGERVKIKELIHKMIKLSGFSVKDSSDPEGDIEIKITGLRPGEKLYEELLIGDNPQVTSHPKIKKIDEPYISFDELEKYLIDLNNLLNKNQTNEVKDLLQKLIPLYTPNSNIVDHVHTEQQS